MVSCFVNDIIFNIELLYRAVGSSRASRALALPLLGLGTKIITNYSQSKACSSLSSLGNGAKPSRVQNRSNTITL